MGTGSCSKEQGSFRSIGPHEKISFRGFVICSQFCYWINQYMSFDNLQSGLVHPLVSSIFTCNGMVSCDYVYYSFRLYMIVIQNPNMDVISWWQETISYMHCSWMRLESMTFGFIGITLLLHMLCLWIFRLASFEADNYPSSILIEYLVDTMKMYIERVLRVSLSEFEVI